MGAASSRLQDLGLGDPFCLAIIAQPGASRGLSFPGQATRLMFSAFHSSSRRKAACVSWTHLQRILAQRAAQGTAF